MKDVNWFGYRFLSQVGLGLIVLMVVVGFSELGLMATFISVLCLALPAAVVLFHRKMPAAFVLVFVIAADLSAAGWAWDLYARIPHYDGPVHIFSTLSMTLLVAYYIYGNFVAAYAHHPWLFAMTLIAIGTSIGAGWEIVEYFFIPAARMGLYDTITDLVTDAIGAVLSVPLMRWAHLPQVS